MKDYHGVKQEEFYDNIIRLLSLKASCTSEGFNVIASEKGLEHYNEQKEKNGTVIGVVGNAKKGKTYILGKISKNELPFGHSVTTEGICVKYPTIEDTTVIILDSAGSEAPLVENDEVKLSNLSSEVSQKEIEEAKSQNKKKSENELIEQIADIARDKQATETFLQNFILFCSNVLIIVVGQLTYSDQKMINRIKRELWNQKVIFIIHNLMFLEKIEQVNNFIERNVLTSITFGELIQCYIREEYDNKNNDIYYKNMNIIIIKKYKLFIYLWQKKEVKQEIILIIVQ